MNTRLLTQEKKPFGLVKILYLLSNVLSRLEIDFQSRAWIAIRANLDLTLNVAYLAHQAACTGSLRYLLKVSGPGL